MKKHPLGQNPDFRKLFQQLNGQYSGKKPEDGQGEKDGTPEPERFDSNGNPVKKKKKRRRFARGGKVAAAAVILILLGTNSYYILDEENYAVVSTLGSAQAAWLQPITIWAEDFGEQSELSDRSVWIMKRSLERCGI